MTDTDDRALITLSGIEKVFLTDELETHALSDVHLVIERGDYVAIEGPSGSGKTTLLSILGLLDAPSRGRHVMGGREVQGLDARERARIRNREIGFIFQTFNLIGDLTVAENVELPLRYRDMPAAERKRRVDSALERVQMAHRKGHMPSQLSGGQLMNGSYVGSTGTIKIAPVDAPGTIVYWTTSGGSALRGFRVGDKNLQTVLTPQSITAAGRSSREMTTPSRSAMLNILS